MPVMPFLQESDLVLRSLIIKEVTRQREGLELIASENVVSESIMEALGTPLTNKYSEGYPGKRYYGGNEVIDEIEQLAIGRAKELFGAEHVNVQPHAGSSANLAAYLALVKPGDAIMALDLSHGGHLTHGSKVNFSGRLFRIIHYGVRRDTELIDMDEVMALAKAERPNLIVAGYTSYPRHLDFAAFRRVADEVGCHLMVDMAHFAGLVAAKLHPDPVPYADVVTTTTHKTLRGPRGAIILCRQYDRLDPTGLKTLAERIDSSVFPGSQGGPLDHAIAGKAACFKEAMEPSFRDYQAHVLANAKALALRLVERGLRVVTGGTDNHLVILDLTPTGVSGRRAEQLLDLVGLHTNRNLIPFDTRKSTDPSGLRLGTATLTTRGLDLEETRRVADLIGDVLLKPNDAAVAATTLAAVREIAAAHPIYPDWK
jgi:glycine hydroxymethyltransferase